MIKDIIKSSDKKIFFGYIKFKNKFDNSKKIVFHKKFVKKILKKTELKIFLFLIMTKKINYQNYVKTMVRTKDILTLAKKIYGLGNLIPILTCTINCLIIVEKM